MLCAAYVSLVRCALAAKHPSPGEHAHGLREYAPLVGEMGRQPVEQLGGASSASVTGRAIGVPIAAVARHAGPLARRLVARVGVEDRCRD